MTPMVECESVAFHGGTQLWRLLTHAAFLGKIGIAFLFNVFWL